MTKYRITTPVPGFTGISAGLNFTDGTATMEAPEPPAPPAQGKELDREQRAEWDRIVQDPAYRRLAYFRAQGYGVEQLDAATARAEGQPSAEQETKQRDGAPSRSASKADWVAYATSEAGGNRFSVEDAEKLTRDQLAEKYLGPKEA